MHLDKWQLPGAAEKTVPTELGGHRSDLGWLCSSRMETPFLLTIWYSGWTAHMASRWRNWHSMPVL